MANAPPPACVLQLPQQLLRLLLWPAYVCRLVPPVRAAPSVLLLHLFLLLLHLCLLLLLLPLLLALQSSSLSLPSNTLNDQKNTLDDWARKVILIR